ncbi:MAG: type II toxin-antitoxin system PemK/MazF family toxin [Oscillospiraceae bacterium]|nr:type II toxin-antitoxin system PemK/MazF family toxin [Oscillospiraceae bacterium]
MKPYDIHIALVEWDMGGKRRPVLILGADETNAIVFQITTQYKSKSDTIREKYFIISDWKQAGLHAKSYVDTNSPISVPFQSIESVPIGKLTEKDVKNLREFLLRNS